jgi:hypothetical protein
MEIISALLVSLSLFFTGFMSPAEPSVEVGISTVSPAGIQGGYAVPASGCSTWHSSGPNDCDSPIITANRELVPSGSTVEISWNPFNHKDCTLSSNLTGNANVAGNEDVIVENTTRYTIKCTDGPPGGAVDGVTVEVIPTTFEI